MKSHDFKKFFIRAGAKAGLAVTLGVTAILLSSFSGFGVNPASELFDSDRGLTSASFPNIPLTSDEDEILNSYPAYLKFALDIGKDVDSDTARRLSANYQALRKRSPEYAARFLKGLRFEMVQKIELMGLSSSSITTKTPAMRRWVGKYLKEWNREADEHLFRALTMKTRE